MGCIEIAGIAHPALRVLLLLALLRSRQIVHGSPTPKWPAFPQPISPAEAVSQAQAQIPWGDVRLPAAARSVARPRCGIRRGAESTRQARLMLSAGPGAGRARRAGAADRR